MVEDQVDRRPRRETRQLPEELHSLEEPVRRAVAPGLLPLHPYAAVAQQAQTIVGQRGAEEIATELLPARPVVGAHPDVGGEVEAFHVRVARSPCVRSCRGPMTQPAHPRPGPRA